MVTKTIEEGLEGRISLDRCYFLGWEKELKEKGNYARDIARRLLQYLSGVENIKVSYFGLKDGKSTKRLEEGHLIINPAIPGNKILSILGLEREGDFRVISKSELAACLEYKNSQSVIVYFDYSDNNPLFSNG